MIVVLTTKAEANLEQIADYISEDNPKRAVSFVDELLARCAALTDMPFRFPLLRDHQESGIRKLHHADYLVFYRAGETRIEILHVLNAAQDYESILFPKP